VADLGCGPGTLTVALARRWPAADVEGIDNSAEMIEAARALPEARQGKGLHFTLGDVSDWAPDEQPDVIISNAVLQWIPGHLEVLARWAGLLRRGGWLAIQVPGNFDQPSHAVLRELTSSARWREPLAGVKLNSQAAEPAEYLGLLASAGFDVDAWETTYQHVLHGEDPVVSWYQGTGLRPVLTALGPAEAQEFLADYRTRIAREYPPASYGTVLPFRRVFAVAVRR
jgi:trans-aconitate 2-methyltransferase